MTRARRPDSGSKGYISQPSCFCEGVMGVYGVDGVGKKRREVIRPDGRYTLRINTAASWRFAIFSFAVRNGEIDGAVPCDPDVFELSVESAAYGIRRAGRVKPRPLKYHF